MFYQVLDTLNYFFLCAVFHQIGMAALHLPLLLHLQLHLHLRRWTKFYVVWLWRFGLLREEYGR